jgi:hypothetical protein
MAGKIAKYTPSTDKMVANSYPNRLRSRIKTSKILSKLNRCALGKEEMTSVQFQAAKLLISKTLADAVQPKVDDSMDIKDVSHVPTWKLLEAIDAEVIPNSKEVSKTWA